jgi:hypothetical protein
MKNSQPHLLYKYTLNTSLLIVWEIDDFVFDGLETQNSWPRACHYIALKGPKQLELLGSRKALPFFEGPVPATFSHFGPTLFFGIWGFAPNPKKWVKTSLSAH